MKYLAIVAEVKMKVPFLCCSSSLHSEMLGHGRDQTVHCSRELVWGFLAPLFF